MRKMKSLEKGPPMVLLDLQKALDSADHFILLEKLRNSGLQILPAQKLHVREVSVYTY